jgi:hypothetical protein
LLTKEEKQRSQRRKWWSATNFGVAWILFLASPFYWSLSLVGWWINENWDVTGRKNYRRTIGHCWAN